ncbi:alpha/beta hydrolase [Thiohalobacter sp.]|uniref:alpha/beta hydrolase n=1 Tax=Thiohalobacter sp. TaxID=2025948 RepID=UPI002631BBE9|nr:alpha/beta hydrolase [Thiohalobacter sp.]
MNKRHRSSPRQPARLRLLRLAFRWLGPVAPRPFGRLASELWFRTHRFPEPPRETRIRERAREGILEVDGLELAAYQWGPEQAPTIALVHGWNGRATQLGAFIDPLLARGFRVVGLDAPGHGRSAGNATDLYQCARALRALADREGPLHGLIAHSFGALITAQALGEGLALQRCVLVAPPAGPDLLLERFQAMLAIPPAVMADMTRRIAQRFGEDFRERLQVARMLGDRACPALIIHDRDDRDAPLTDAEALAAHWARAELMITEGLGHRRILRDAEVIGAGVGFIDGESK